MLIEYGYKLDYDDVVLATRHKVKIKDITKFDIKFTDGFLDVCTKADFYPYELPNLKANQGSLLTECSISGNLPMIRKLVDSGVKPTVECLMAASKHRTNNNTIRYLLGYVKADTRCIINFAKRFFITQH